MKKTYRPLWSYDVPKTEQWLSNMASKGWRLARLNRWTRCFYFKDQEPEPALYRISYKRPTGSSLPETLKTEGWKNSLSTGNWQFISNTQPENHIHTSPFREGIVKHNRMISYLFMALLIYLVSIIVNGVAAFFSWLLDTSVIVEESPLWVLTYLFFGLAIALTVFSIYSIFKINKSNALLEGSLIQQPKTASKLEEKELKNSGRWITKVRIGWIYSPDKLETWLESMAQRGFHLERVSGFGTLFHFAKGQPRLLAYRADYQNAPSASYYAIHEEAGWSNNFSSRSRLENWNIWSRDYAKPEEPPELYTDLSSRLKHAKRIAVTCSVLFLPLLGMYLYFLTTMIQRQNNVIELVSASTLMFVLAIGIFGSFVYRIWAYYMRLRKLNA